MNMISMPRVLINKLDSMQKQVGSVSREKGIPENNHLQKILRGQNQYNRNEDAFNEFITRLDTA